MDEVVEDSCQLRLHGASPRVMGIINVTPDSFHDGGQFAEHDRAVAHGLQLIAEGADILDIGGESTRPGSRVVDPGEEQRRILPVIRELSRQTSIPISVDTSKPEVAKAALEAGAQWINDVTGCQNPQMRRLVAESGVQVIVMHMQGTPQTMQIEPHYPQGVVPTIYRWFEHQIQELVAFGISEEQLILDPGIGFGKTVAHNLEILRNIKRFKSLGFPLLIGASRKSFLQKILKKPSPSLLSASIAAHTIALTAQVDIIRVHDVAQHRDAVDLLTAIGKL